MATSTKTRKRNRFLAAVLLPVALLLSACSIKMEVNVNTDQTVDLVYTMDMREMFGMGGGSETPEQFCNGLLDSFLAEHNGTDGKLSVKNVGTESEPVCELTAKGVPTGVADGMEFQFEGDTVTVLLNGSSMNDDPSMQGMEGFLDQIDLSFTIAFPGPVKEASVGEIDGNKVVISKMSDFQQDGKIVASMVPGAGGGSLLWILLIVGAVLVVGGGVAFFVISNNKKKAAAAAAPAYPAAQDYGQGYGAPGQAYPSAQPYGQAPAAPAAPAAPGAQPYGQTPGQAYPPAQPYGQAPSARPYPPSQPYGQAPGQVPPQS
ncbi:MAG: hypothetical protein Q3999_02870 [Buchananella hordeovulneris]|nr:hypothetical protein [Buchananella hordeovulneris]